MTIRWVTNISSRSPKLEWTRLTHTTPHIAKKIKKVTERTNYIFDTLSTEYTQQAFMRIFSKILFSYIFSYMPIVREMSYNDSISNNRQIYIYKCLWDILPHFYPAQYVTTCIGSVCHPFIHCLRQSLAQFNNTWHKRVPQNFNDIHGNLEALWV